MVHEVAQGMEEGSLPVTAIFSAFLEEFGTAEETDDRSTSEANVVHQAEFASLVCDIEETGSLHWSCP